jgi:hypothetical protein
MQSIVLFKEKGYYEMSFFGAYYKNVKTNDPQVSTKFVYILYRTFIIDSVQSEKGVSSSGN